MKRDLSVEALVGLPVLSSSTALVLCTQIITTASNQKDALAGNDLSLPPPIADALQDLESATQELAAVRVPVVTDPTAKKEADTSLDTAWKNLHRNLMSWYDTAAPANTDPEGTKQLMSFLFADGLKFIRIPFLEQWEASQSRLARLAAEPAYTQTIARLNLQPMLQVVQEAHGSYGVVLGVTQSTGVSDSTVVRQALNEVIFRLRVYVLQVVAHAYTRAAGAQALAEALLEPLAVWVSAEPEKSTASASSATASGSTASASTSSATGSASTASASTSPSASG